MGAHALLSPSASHRWLHCTAAPRLEEASGIADRGSTYAEEGTLAHAIAARKIRRTFGMSTHFQDEEIAALSERYHTGEMEEYTDAYMALVLEKFNRARLTTPDAELYVETILDLTAFIPDAYGTADAVIIADGCIEVIDLKYGRGVKVSAERNTQMMIYALGTLDQFSAFYDIRSVRMTIVQPRMDNLSEWEIGARELEQWGENVLKPLAKEAYAGGMSPVPGDWCRFCKVQGLCSLLALDCLRPSASRRLLSAEELASEVLPRLPLIKSWIGSVEETALSRAMQGETLPGWKLVEGRSVRKIVRPDEAAAALRAAGYAEEEIFKPRELRSISDMERGIGKKRFTALLSDFIDKPKGKPTLAPADDKREAIDPVAADFDGIEV